MDKSVGRRRRAPFMVALSMYWIRGGLYIGVSLIGWYFIKPVLPQLMELTGSGSALITFSLFSVFGPLVVGWLAVKVINPLFVKITRRRDYLTLEERIVRELAPDETRTFPIVLVSFPSETVRSIGLLASTFESPDGSTVLASVYLPRAPDPSNGTLRVVGAESIEYTDWTFRDFIRYHYSFGATGQDPDLALEHNVRGKDS